MNTFALKLGGLLALVVLVAPAGAQAYRFVDSSTVQVSSNTYLLTHTYTAGFLNEDVQTPIAAAQEGGTDVGYPQVGYAIDGVSAAALQGAEVNAIVLSNTAIVDNRYQTLAGNRDMFTLFALVTMSNAVGAQSDISLAMRSLPFSYTRDGEEKTGSYNLEAAASPETPEAIIS